MNSLIRKATTIDDDKTMSKKMLWSKNQRNHRKFVKCLSHVKGEIGCSLCIYIYLYIHFRRRLLSILFLVPRRETQFSSIFILLKRFLNEGEKNEQMMENSAPR